MDDNLFKISFLCHLDCSHFFSAFCYENDATVNIFVHIEFWFGGLFLLG